LRIGGERKAKTLLRFFRFWGRENTKRLRFICSDMWKPYSKVIAKKASQAVHVLDRFHIMCHLNKAMDVIRAEESKRLVRDGFRNIATVESFEILFEQKKSEIAISSNKTPSRRRYAKGCEGLRKYARQDSNLQPAD
jgi:transposase